MPYIHANNRKGLSFNPTPTTPGELNYLLTLAVQRYIETSEDGLCYTTINDAIGALECCKQELYRRVATPYEEIKIKANGDVFSKQLLSV